MCKSLLQCACLFFGCTWAPLQVDYGNYCQSSNNFRSIIMSKNGALPGL